MTSGQQCLAGIFINTINSIDLMVVLAWNQIWCPIDAGMDWPGMSSLLGHTR